MGFLRRYCTICNNIAIYDTMFSWLSDKSTCTQTIKNGIKPRAGAQTAGRALEFLKVFVAQDGPVGLSEMTAASKLDKSAAHRLLRELESRAFIEREANGKRYIMGPELIALSSKVLTKVDV